MSQKPTPQVAELDRRRFRAYVSELRVWDVTRPRNDFYKHLETKLGTAEKDVATFMSQYHAAFEAAVPAWTRRRRRRLKRKIRDSGIGLSDAEAEATAAVDESPALALDPAASGPEPKRARLSDAGDSAGDTAGRAPRPKRRKRKSAGQARLPTPTATPERSATHVLPSRPAAGPSATPSHTPTPRPRAVASRATVAMAPPPTATATPSRPIEGEDAPAPKFSRKQLQAQLEQERKERKELEDDARSTAAELVAARALIAELEPLRGVIDVRDALATDLKTVKAKLKKSKAERKQLATDFTSQAVEVRDLTGQRDALDERNNELAAERDSIQAERNGLEIERSGLEAAVNRLTKERDSAVAQAQRRKAKRGGQIEEIRANCDATNDELKKSHNAATKLRETEHAREIEALIAQHEEAMSAVVDKADKLKAGHAAKVDRLNTLISEMAKRHDVQVAALESRYAAKLKELDGQHTAIIEEGGRLKTERDHFMTERDSFKIERDGLEVAVARITKERDNTVAELKADHTTQIEVIEAARTAELKEMKASYDALTAQLDGIKADRDGFEQAATRAAKEWDDATAKLKLDHTTEVEEIKAANSGKVDELNHHRAALEIERDGLKAECDGLKETVALLTQQRDDNAYEIEGIKAAHRTELDEFNHRLTAVEAERDRFNVERDRFKKERDDFEATTTRLSKEREDAIIQLTSNHATEIKSINGKHGAELEAIKAAHDALAVEHLGIMVKRDALDATVARLTQGQDVVITKLKTQHAAEIKAERYRLEETVAWLKQERDDAVTNLKAEHAAEVKAGRDRGEQTVARLTKEKVDAIAELKVKHTTHIEVVKASHSAEFEEMTRRFAGLEEECDAIEDERYRFKTERDHCKAQRDRLEAAVVGHMKVHDRTVAELNEAHDTEIAEIIAAHDTDISNLKVRSEEEISRLRSQLEDRLEQLEKHQQQYAKDALARCAVAAVESRLAVVKEEKDRAVKAMEDAEEGLRRVSAELDIIKAERDALTNQLAESQSTQAETAMTAIRLFQQEKANVEAVRDGLKTQLTQCERRLGGVQREKAEIENERNGIATKLFEAERSHASAMRQLVTDHSAEIERLHTTRAASVEHLKQKHEGELHSFRVANQGLEEYRKRVTAELESLCEHRDALKVLDSQSTIGQQYTQAVKAERDNLRMILGSVREALGVSPAESVDLAAYCRTITAELQHYRKARNAQGEAINPPNEMTDELTAAFQKNAELRAELTALNRFRDELVHKHQRQEAELKEHRDKIDKATTYYSRAMQEVKRLKSEAHMRTAERNRHISEHNKKVKELKARHATECESLRADGVAMMNTLEVKLGVQYMAKKQAHAAEVARLAASHRTEAVRRQQRHVRAVDVLLLVIAHHEREREAMQGLLGKREGCSTESTAAIDQHIPEAVNVPQAIVRLERQLADAHANHGVTQGELKRRLAEIDSGRQQIRLLNHQLTKYHEQLVARQQAAHERGKKIAQLETELDERGIKVGLLEAEINMMRKDLDEAEEEIETNAGQIKELKAAIAARDAEREALKKVVADDEELRRLRTAIIHHGNTDGCLQATAEAEKLLLLLELALTMRHAHFAQPSGQRTPCPACSQPGNGAASAASDAERPSEGNV